MIAFIDDHREAYGVEPICKVLPIAPSTYHAHIAQRIDASKRSARAQRDAELKIEVQRVFAENFGVYGVRKVWRQLRREGFTVARCTDERLMASLGLQGAIRGKPVRTTISDKAVPCPLDHVNRQFHALRPNALWVSDFSEMSRLLRLALLADAAASGATAALLVASADFLGGRLGLPMALMREAGMVLIPYVMFVVLVASRPAAPVNAVNVIIGINAAWTAASSLLLVSGWVTPTLLGIAFVLAQAFAVGAFGVIQYLCLEHASSAATG